MKLFISYSRDDKAWVSELWRALRDENHDAWMDRFIVPASDWWESILHSVEACECFIYVMTPKSVESIYCRAEMEYAAALNKPVLPLMLKPCTFPEILSKARIQFQTISDEMSMDRVLVRIEQGLGLIRVGYTQGKYAQRRVNRPSEPQASRDPEEALQIAEDAIAAQNYDVAVKMLEEVAACKRKILVALAKERLAEVQQLRQCGEEYASIKKLVSNPALGQRAWKKYQQSECAGFDPDNLAAHFGSPTPVKAEPIMPSQEAPAIPPRPAPAPEKDTSPMTASQIARHMAGLYANEVNKILPAPFNWILIAAGKVTLKPGGYAPAGGHTYDVPQFAIAKYPVTNAQFARFITAGGYDEKKWWTEAGWQIHEKENWNEPRHRSDARWNGGEHPVVGVSWYEAMAFCLWLSDVSGEKITLPSDRQWQRAAQGSDGRAYPWGGEWDGNRCNNSVKPLRSFQTTSVRHYEGKGDSPLGVVDMAGNVEEWCLTDYEQRDYDARKDATYRILMGGAWSTGYADRLRADYRNRLNPDYRGSERGFRIACSV